MTDEVKQEPAQLNRAQRRYLDREIRKEAKRIMKRRKRQSR